MGVSTEFVDRGSRLRFFVEDTLAQRNVEVAAVSYGGEYRSIGLSAKHRFQKARGLCLYGCAPGQYLTSCICTAGEGKRNL